MQGYPRKKLTPGNWLEIDHGLPVMGRPSPVDGSLLEISRDEWMSSLMGAELPAHIPCEVRRPFEVARGTLAYGYFYYPLYSNALRELNYACEAALRFRCRVSGCNYEFGSCAEMLDHLVGKDELSREERDLWDEILSYECKGDECMGDIRSPATLMMLFGNLAARISALFPQKEDG